jgi:hypothetical protein
MLKTTTKWEMHYSSDERLDLNCKEDLALFIPEYSNATLEACIEHYKENFTTDCEQKNILKNIWLLIF